LKPLLLKHFRIHIEPPERGGESALVFTSERRRIVVNGRSLDVFLDRVAPLLDGRHTLVEIQHCMAGVFDPQDLAESLSALLQHGIAEDAEGLSLDADLQARLAPQLSYLRELDVEPAQVIERLAAAEVAVFGLGAVGAVAATALAAAGVGRLRCADASSISAADPYLAQIFSVADVGRARAEVTRERIRAVNPATSVDLVLAELRSDGDVAAAVGDSDFVLGCVDPGLVTITYKLNRVCLDKRVSWTSASVSAFEGVVGPTVFPHQTACFLCYQMRIAACADDPERALAELRRSDADASDGSAHRENLAFGASIVGQLLALEAFKVLAGLRPSAAGRILTLDFMSCAMQRHVVLRKPTCPACSASAQT
jgi:adenylyltransferase/sulfurtransferase